MLVSEHVPRPNNQEFFLKFEIILVPTVILMREAGDFPGKGTEEDRYRKEEGTEEDK